MSYIDNHLMNNEAVLYRSRLHWIVFMWPAIFLFISLLYFKGSAVQSGIGPLFLVIAIVSAIISFINYKTSEFGITNKRVIAKVGFIKRDSLEVLVSKIEGIHVKQSVLGRILGYGSIVVIGTGGTKDPFRNIDAPLEFRRMVQEQISAVQTAR